MTSSNKLRILDRFWDEHMNPVLDGDFDFSLVEGDMVSKAKVASGYLKAISNETRLVILCHLVAGPRTVTELEQLLGVRQANVSQHLGRLKEDGLVSAQRDGKSVLYSIADPDAMQIIRVLYLKFCACD